MIKAVRMNNNEWSEWLGWKNEVLVTLNYQSAHIVRREVLLWFRYQMRISNFKGHTLCLSEGKTVNICTSSGLDEHEMG